PAEINTITSAVEEYETLTCLKFVPRTTEKDYLYMALNHALGFYHEQMRSDRDSYVDIMFQYISQASWGNFNKADTNNLGLEYDYDSVMHYDGYAFSNTSNQPSIVPKPDPTVPIGQRNGLSTLDVSKINRLYQCKYSWSCRYDSLTVFVDGAKMGPYCSNIYDSEFTSHGNSMVLVFHSDSRMETKGFMASYTF
ncbi:PREDICTED: astacin-like metalloendopeptidase, partial [Nanorana parkeri]|uniref:astacin-like metalloendopeptidase n=1 Tax=Nanorana parkeri TaxID=125878 RepID=UPI000854F600